MTQFNAPTYDIERPTGTCAFTGQAIEPGSAYMATLVELDEAERAALAQSNKPKTGAAVLGLKRIDVSMDAWQQGHRPPKLFSYWKSVLPQPNQKKRLFVDDDVLLNLLRRLGDAAEQQRIAFRFVLTLILMRRKMLRYDATERRQTTVAGPDGQPQEVQQDWWVLTPKLDPAKGPLGKWKEDERIEVLDPHLDEAQTQQISEQLSEILEAEL